jgi:hypothetical protein
VNPRVKWSKTKDLPHREPRGPLVYGLCRSGGESSDGRGGHAVMDLTAWNAWGRRSAAGARKGPMLPAVPVGAPSLASKGGWAGRFPPPHSCFPHMQPVYWRSAPPVSRGGAGGSPGGATPPIGRKTGRYPTRTRKDGGRGSGSPLTRAFAGSKPLRDQPLCPPLGDGWQTDAPCRLTARVPFLAQRLCSRPSA